MQRIADADGPADLGHLGGKRRHDETEPRHQPHARDLLGQHLVGLGADLDLALVGIRLPLLVEGHHDHGRAVLAAQLRLADELLLALFQ